MAGQRPTQVEEAARVPTFLITCYFNNLWDLEDNVLSGGTTETDTVVVPRADFPCFIAPFDMVIEDQQVYFDIGEDNTLGTIVKAASGTAPSSGTHVSTTDGIQFDNAAVNFVPTSIPFRTVRGATVADDGSIGPSENIIKRGDQVSVRVTSGEFSSFFTAAFMIVFRCSSPPK